MSELDAELAKVGGSGGGKPSSKTRGGKEMMQEKEIGTTGF